MTESEAAPHPLKNRRESLGLRESEVAALIGWSVNKIKDYECGKLKLSQSEEERASMAIDSLEKKQKKRR
jgi:transcriptional regulator with XRE-family HTH domain